MKTVYGLDGKQYKFNLNGYSKKSTKKSAPHLKVRALLQSLYPPHAILEEVLLPGTGKLRADFYLPSYSLMVEINGAQHSEYTPHFHGTADQLGRLKFGRAVANDKRKSDWCELNQIELIVLEHDDEENWREKFQI